MRAPTVVVLALAAIISGPTLADEGYVVGITGALSGRSAATYAPAVEALRIYLDRVNAAGGVHGKAINLLVEDDLAFPWKAAVNAKKLLTENEAVLMLNASLSPTYAAVIAEARNAGVPLIFASSVCPKDAYPPTNESQFCTTASAATYDSRAALAFVKEAATEPVKTAFAAMAIPLSRIEMDFAENEALNLGMVAVDKEGILPPTADYTPFAMKIKEAGANWVFSWAPWVTQIRTFEALRRIDWSGEYIAWAHIGAEEELERIKDPKFYVLSANAFSPTRCPSKRKSSKRRKRPAASTRRRK
jgi:branched-chain amino acid transport system substrate-binding protein